MILISIDGFRHDYLDSFPTPALHRLANTGVRAEGMRPQSMRTVIASLEESGMLKRTPHANDGRQMDDGTGPDVPHQGRHGVVPFAFPLFWNVERK